MKKKKPKKMSTKELIQKGPMPMGISTGMLLFCVVILFKWIFQDLNWEWTRSFFFFPGCVLVGIGLAFCLKWWFDRQDKKVEEKQVS